MSPCCLPRYAFSFPLCILLLIFPFCRIFAAGLVCLFSRARYFHERFLLSSCWLLAQRCSVLGGIPPRVVSCVRRFQRQIFCQSFSARCCPTELVSRAGDFHEPVLPPAWFFPSLCIFPLIFPFCRIFAAGLVCLFSHARYFHERFLLSSCWLLAQRCSVLGAIPPQDCINSAVKFDTYTIHIR